MTNYHVIENAEEIRVVLADETSFNAEVLGQDRKTDIAVLKIEMGDLPKLILTTSPGKVGDLVFAIGNPFGVGKLGNQGLYRTMGETACSFFKGQGKITNLKSA